MSCRTQNGKQFKNISELLSLFAQHTNLVSGQGYSTISSVFPAILDIHCHLNEEMKKPRLQEVCSLLQSEMHR
jgi:hypothetical protein